ncbi:MAG: hypothetical protein ABI378_05770 [Chitinophagaceae bacterium]
MQRLVVEIESMVRAKELQSMLVELKFVKKVTNVSHTAGLPIAFKEYEEEKRAIVHRKNKAIVKYI